MFVTLVIESLLTQLVATAIIKRVFEKSDMGSGGSKDEKERDKFEPGLLVSKKMVDSYQQQVQDTFI